MGLLGGLFGGGGQDIETEIEPPKYMEKYLKPYGKSLTDVWQTTMGTDPWSTPTYTGMNPTERAAIRGQLDYLPQFGRQIGAVQRGLWEDMDPQNNRYLRNAYGGAKRAGRTLEQFQKGRRKIRTPGLQSMLNQTANADIWASMYDTMSGNVIDSYRQNILPALRADAQAAGQYGQPKHGQTQELATEGLLNTLGQMGTQFGQMGASEALQTRNLGTQLAQQQAMQNAANELSAAGMGQNAFASIYSPSMSYAAGARAQMPGAIQMGMQPFETMRGLGTFENLTQQQALAEQERLYNQGRMDPMNMHAQYGNMLGAPIRGAPTGSTQSGGGNPMNIADIAMLGLGGYGMGRGFGWWGGGGGPTNPFMAGRGYGMG
jgi:hypothetical protein